MAEIEGELPRLSGGAGAEPPSLIRSARVTLETVAVSEYRTGAGVVLYDGPGIQPSATLTLETDIGTLNLSNWSNFSIGNRPGDFTETDLNVSFRRDIGKDAAVSVGFNNFFFPGSDEGLDTVQEFSLGIHATSVTLPTSLTISRSLSGFEYTQAQLSASYPIKLTEQIVFQPSIQLSAALDRGDLYSGEGLVSGSVAGTLLVNPWQEGPTVWGAVEYFNGFDEPAIPDGFTARFGISWSF